jgi:outer membrane protein
MRLFLISMLALAAFMPAYSQAQEAPLPAAKPVMPSKMTLQDALRAAYVNNPSLRAARAQLLSVGENLSQALSGWQPTVSSGLDVTSSDTSGSNFSSGGSTNVTSKDVSVSIAQPVFRGGKTIAETAEARYSIAAQQALLWNSEQGILRDTAQAYMDVLRDDALLELSQNNRDVIAKQLEASRDRFEVGELTRTDVAQSEARLADAEAGIITARGDLRASYAVFEQVTGMVPYALQVPSVEIAFPDNLEDITTMAQSHSPRVMAAENVHRAAEEGIDGVWAELWPQIDLSSSWNRTYDPQPGLIDEQTTRSIGLSASIPLYQAGSVRSRVRQAKHDANQRYLEILGVRRQVRQEAVENWEDWRAAQAEIRSRKAQVIASEVAREGVKQETDLGARTVLDALDADQELLDAKVALVTAQRNEVVARFDLAATLGLLMPDALGFGDEAIVMEEKLGVDVSSFLNMNVDRVQKTE